jgi:hypothetical protein
MMRALPALLLAAALLVACAQQVARHDESDSESCPLPALVLLDPDC